MPLKLIFEKAPLTAMTALPLRAGLVRMENAAIAKLYGITANSGDPLALEGTLRLACILKAKPGDEPVVAKIRALLEAQKADGSFPMTYKESVALLRAAWALYELEAKKTLLDSIARWCSYAVQNWDVLMADKSVRVYSADLLEVLENFYRVTGKTAVLTLCERLANQAMVWSGVLNTVSTQQPANKIITQDEIKAGLNKEDDGQEGYFTQFVRMNHAESLADGARSTMAKGWYSGSATELNATKNGWARLSRYHGAVCGGLTSDELLEGTSPASSVSTAALGAWAEALCAAAMAEKSEWAFDALERMVYNAMPACITGDGVAAFQRVNTMGRGVEEDKCSFIQEDLTGRSVNRLVRGYAAIVSACVTARNDGASINLYMPGRYAVPVGEGLVIFNMTVSAKGASITVHCKQETRAAVRLRMPAWSRSTEIRINGADIPADVMNDMISYNRNWNDGDVISVAFDTAIAVEDGHHQGKYVMRGPVLMAMPIEGEWSKSFVSAVNEDNHVIAVLDKTQDWKVKGNEMADIPVLPDAVGEEITCQLIPYARTKARVALFPRRKQA